ncbi:MAG: hypothetical protein ACT4N2_01365 [Hyphomicrobium sp.]
MGDRRRRNLLSALVAFGLLGGGFSGAAFSDDPFDPFGEPETSRPPRPARPEAPPSPYSDRPYLPPMEGRFSREGPRPSPADRSEAFGPAAGENERAVPTDAYGQDGNRYEDRPSLVPDRIERTTLDPLDGGPPGDGSAGQLPPPPRDSAIGPHSTLNVLHDPWRGLALADLEALLAGVEIPPRSATLRGLWMRLVSVVSPPRASVEEDQQLAAIRAEALDRSGDPVAARAAVQALGGADNPVVRLITARTAIGLGDRDAGCATARTLAGEKDKLPKRLAAEAFVMAGYCAAAGGNLPGAGIGAELARENGLAGNAGPDLLDALALGSPLTLPKDRPLGPIDFRMLLLGGEVDKVGLADVANPALLKILAGDATASSGARLAAGERAAALSIISPDELALIYRSAAGTAAGGTDLTALDSAGEGGAPARAVAFAGIEAEPSHGRRARMIRALLDSARRVGLAWPVLQVVHRPAQAALPSPDLSWFAETAIEIAVAAGDFDAARSWVDVVGGGPSSPAGGLDHWLVLADIADARRTGSLRADLDAVTALDRRQPVEPQVLHRLVTVLDALAIAIPPSLWEAASRTPQPAGGHLPDTGTLPALADASKSGVLARTVLLAMKALGSNGAEGAHVIALGDSIRALKRVGLETEARALALEAVFASWPRTAAY